MWDSIIGCYRIRETDDLRFFLKLHLMSIPDDMEHGLEDCRSEMHTKKNGCYWFLERNKNTVACMPSHRGSSVS